MYCAICFQWFNDAGGYLCSKHRVNQKEMPMIMAEYKVSLPVISWEHAEKIRNAIMQVLMGLGAKDVDVVLKKIYPVFEKESANAKR